MVIEKELAAHVDINDNRRMNLSHCLSQLTQCFDACQN